MANSQIVRERETAGDASNQDVQGGARGAIVQEVMGDIIPWRKRRDQDFEALWDEFYAKWRGFWSPQHKSYKTERSKLISPLTSMAIDLTVSEIVEAVFGREYFVDIPDNIEDDQQEDVAKCRMLLIEDLKKVGFIDEFGKSALNGALYGNGIMKIQVTTTTRKVPYRTSEGELIAAKKEEVVIKPVAIDPGAFVADPGCPDIDDMKGCAHEFQMPLHTVKSRQRSGLYYNDVVIGKWSQPVLSPNRGPTEEGNRRDQGDVAFITEYYGLVPTRLYLAAVAEGSGNALDDEMIEAIPEEDMTEVIATIANETHLLRVIETPLITGERLVMAYQHETVPHQFNGRSSAEKGSNVQRAMDAEMRARIDALAWSNNPMFAGDLTRLPPGSNKNAWPGKFWGTRGDPREIIQEFRLSGPDANSYQHMQDLERMGQQATGALDTPSLRAGVRDETATGSALAASGFIKRAKRTMYNIEGFLNKLVRRTLHLKMQFEPSRYENDYDFQVKGTVGIMAREIEAQFMIDMLRVLGPDSGVTMPVVKGILEHSGSPIKTTVLREIAAQEEANQPSEEMQQLMEQAKLAQLQAPILQVEELKAKIEKLYSEANLKEAQAEKTDEETDNIESGALVQEIKVLNDLKETANQERQLDIQEEKLDVDRMKIKQQAANKSK